MTLVRFSQPPASALCSAAPGPGCRGFFLRAAGPARRLTAALAANDRVVLGCGLLTLDYLATVDAYPRPDDKIRTGGLQISGGGNAGNALTGAARLGLNTRLISKVGNDEFGETVLQELKEVGIDISHVIISDGGNTTFSYVIIDKQTTVQADQVKIPILVDAEPERTKAELEGMLSVASYIVCSAKFPEKWTSIPSIPSALLEILLQYPRAKFVIITLGENGCMMLERSQQGDQSGIDAADIENVAESLKLEVHKDDILPTCVSSKFMRLSGRGFGTLFGRLLIGTAENIPASELVDTTGCGDAFIGAVLHGVSTEMPPEKMLPFACQVAAIKCRAVGARAGLPWQSDPRLAKFLG
ncbi:hypothetical protein EJB05_22062 [Eragrostis curvula]|uniref:Carbohydrate kinase PfkB domain-containing protein n=1 Tax=Eragrostis curvula TaxID=38414 RepID=A0A5J9V4K8_9POAL|nr:hypothetical protein EJB05_22062 [Eragrostis curvula]